MLVERTEALAGKNAANSSRDANNINNKIDLERLGRVSKRCDNAHDLLMEIRKKIEQIIEFKKKNPRGGADEMYRRQVAAFMAAVENLAKINEGVGRAAAEVRELCDQANLLLGKKVAAERQAGVGLGTRGEAPSGEEER